ncbi:MAG: class I SAM-dependent methyltransferase [Elusimicrobiales bacterium]
MLKGRIRTILRGAVRADQEGLRVHEAVMRLLRRVGRAGSLLDVGCAEGGKAPLYAAALSVPPGCVTGVEGNKAHCLEASSKFKAECVDFEREKLPFADESFEVVVCNQVLEHLKNIFLPLSEMDRVVKTGGWLLIGIPNLAALHNRALLLAGRQPLCNDITGPHIRCFTHSAFKAFLRSNPNFKLAATESSTLYPFPYPFVDLLGRKLPGLAASTFYLLKKEKHDPAACGWNLASIGDTLLD